MAKKVSGLTQPTYEHILNMIMSKQLMPGEKIPEQKIAEDFGTSRSPVRDAMRLLANEGLIRIYPNRFAQVEEYDEKKIFDIGTLRISLDTMAIKLAFLYGSRADFLNLREIADKCASAYAQKDYNLRIKYDSDFHLELARLSQNQLLMKFQSQLYLQVQFIMLHNPDLVDDNVSRIGQHCQIADALMNSDEELALSIIVDHLTSFYRLRDKYPEHFFQSLNPLESI